ncbi:ABC transporter substrate-binding protein [Egicoccus sp. AB-alg2]|uniref:peptide ABC transporter substrate-binding protein n=1 Tax=Egicoccus sp. AB-alg2 TaxID=3242693 RepID=UPI00359CE6F7
MRMRSYTRTFGAVAAASLLITACGGGGDDPVADPGDDGGNGDATEPAEQTAGGEFSIHNCEPQSLIPQDSTEVCGSKVLDQLFSGLYEYDPETYEPVPVMAESLESDDAQNWTVTIRDDFTFHDGTPVTAQSFVDAWNFAVDPDAANRNANFFENFVGYEEVQAGETDAMAGVEAVDDTTITIELTEPFSPLETMLGYTAFYPLPEVAYDDMDAFEEAPVGNGRYQMDGVWERDQQIAMTRYDEWPGENPGLADRIVWQIYSDINTAYLDVQQGNLDILDGIPPEREGAADADFGEDLIRTDTSSFTYMGFPMYDERFEDVDVRRAFSMAIDREAIINAIFAGARQPATALIPPVLATHREDACEACTFDPEQAQQLLDEAGGFDGELVVYFNSGAGHEEWVEAVSNQWRENLGIENIRFESLEFAQYLDLLEGGQIEGPFRLGWVLSYGSPQYALEPLYTSGGSSNYFGIESSQVDDLIGEANATPDLDEAEGVYQQAEDAILEELPNIPLWYETRTTVHTPRVSNVIMDGRTFVRVEQVSVED